MFLLRLKTEFSENFKLIIAFWAILAVITWSFFDWWNGSLTDRDDFMGPIAFLVAGLLIVMLVGTMFKRDDLKDPHEFWTTRPIRGWTLFGTKLIIAFVTIVLPIGVLMTVIGLMAGAGFSAIWQGLEAMLWASFATFLLSMSSMAYPGGNRALLGVFGFFGGVILTSIFLSTDFAERLLESHELDGMQVGSNLLLVLFFLTVWFIWQCIRQIRNKHLHQSPALIITIGILSVLVIALVPLPKIFTGGGDLAATTTLPEVTKAELQTSESYYAGMSFGTKYGAKFVSMSIDLLSDQKLTGDAFTYSDFNLTVTGVSGVPQLAEMTDITIRSSTDFREIIEARPKIQYSVFDREPILSSGSSSGSNPDLVKIVESLPRKKVRIQGAIHFTRFNYKTIHSSSLAEPFEIKKEDLRVGFLNKMDPYTNHQNSVVWKSYSPPLVSAMPNRNFYPVRFRIEHPEAPDTDWFEQLNGGGSGGNGFFGNSQSTELRISNREIESNYNWDKLVERGYKKTAEEWKKEARLICQIEDETHLYILPVDVEVEVPDPVMIRELMLKGEL